MTPGILNSSHGDFHIDLAYPMLPHVLGTSGHLCNDTAHRHLLPGVLPNSRLRRASVHHKPCCWCKQLGHSEPPSSGDGENPPQVQVPRHQPRTNMATFLGAQSGDGNTCLHTTPAPTPESPLNAKAPFRFPTAARSQGSAFLHSDARSVRPQAAHTSPAHQFC